MSNRIISFFDIVIVTVLGLTHPLGPLRPTPPPTIPDKVEVHYRKQQSQEAIRRKLTTLDRQLSEIQYYLRVHNVTDEGYNMVAAHNNRLRQCHHHLTQVLASTASDADTARRHVVATRHIPARQRTMVAVRTHGGFWKAGRFHAGCSLNGKGITRDASGRIVCAIWQADTIIRATRKDSLGTYSGQMDRSLRACGYGTYDAADGSHYEGAWTDDKRHGFGFESSPDRQARVGTWKEGRFLGEKLNYTAERIYGIDISRHQHEKGRRRFNIDWARLRITSLGKRHDAHGLTFPVSFVYIKSTEGTTIRNRYFIYDYAKAKRHGLRVGAYHFFSTRTTAEAQATYFIRHTLFRKDDFPPVLDVEPSDTQIRQMGGQEELLRRIRIFMQMVERQTGMRPILYVNQMFVNKYLQDADDIKQRYNVWIARYGEYKPDVRLVYWQLSPDGHVDGIHGDVDINVFNGYKSQWDEFLRTGFHQ